MFDVYSNKRREPRVKLHTHVTVSGCDANGDMFTCDTVTVDVSPHGASFMIESPMRCGSIVDFSTRNYQFRTRAVVRAVDRDRATGNVIVGVEYLDEAKNPVVIWDTPAARTAQS
jgi:PilZ domain-containing protein